MLAVLHDLGLETYIAKDAVAPGFSDLQNQTKDEETALKKWHEGNIKAWTQIKLSVGDSEMVHLSGAKTAWKMWDQLCMVKESKGWIRILVTH